MILRLSLASFLLFSSCQQATIPGRSVTEIDPRIWCIHQDSAGDYWFGSNGNGVYRYDGSQILQFDRTNGLSGSQVRDIEEDGEGNVFISTNDGVDKFDGERLNPLELVVAPDGEGWVLDPDDVWIVHNPGAHGPCRYDGETLYRLEFSKSPAEDLARNSNIDWPASGIYSIYEDPRGHLWFGTAGAGLCRFDGQTLSWMDEDSLTTTPSGGAFGIRSIYEDRAGDLWVCNTRQRFQVSPEVTFEDGCSLLQYERTEGLPNASADTDVNFDYFPSMTEDLDGALWMACGSNGVIRYDGEDVTRFELGFDTYVITIFCDRNGKLWLGTLENGIYAYEGSRFEPFRPQAPNR